MQYKIKAFESRYSLRVRPKPQAKQEDAAGVKKAVGRAWRS
jgi:hypothetical protein